MNKIANAALTFKSGLYRYYAPWLYKIVKLRAWYFLSKECYDSGLLDDFAQYLWNKFIYTKMSLGVENSGEPVLQLNSRGTHKTAFILGCGPSINKLEEKDWETIRQGFSIGVNNFYIHDFTANAYFCEFVDNKKFQNLIYQRLLNNPSRKSCRVHLAGRYVVLRSMVYTTPEQVKPVFYFSHPVRFQDTRLLKYVLQDYYLGQSKALSHHISNMDTVINYCVRQGFKKIVLVGVDLGSDGYFWDHEEHPHYLQGRAMLKSYQEETAYQSDLSGHHATASKSTAQKLGKLTIVEYLMFIQEHFLLPLGIELTVSNSDSLLADILPVETNFHAFGQSTYDRKEQYTAI